MHAHTYTGPLQNIELHVDRCTNYAARRGSIKPHSFWVQQTNLFTTFSMATKFWLLSGYVVVVLPRRARVSDVFQEQRLMIMRVEAREVNHNRGWYTTTAGSKKPFTAGSHHIIGLINLVVVLLSNQSVHCIKT